MTSILMFLPTLVFVWVMLCWFIFAGSFVWRRKPPSPPDQKRNRGSLVGLALQGLSYAIVWSVHREFLTPIVSGSSLRETLSVVGNVIAMVAAAASVWLVIAAVKTLGKEWSLTARLVEGHKLATSGPYAYVRHPIYTAMLGMLTATGLAISRWQSLVAALVVFMLGTIIRLRSEEKLLREAFGEEFEVYAQRVAALVPGLY
jgi:protein-S-isoprenylcysteine O-methyltransferase Ste14